MEFEELGEIIMLSIADAQHERAKRGSKISSSLILLLLMSYFFCYALAAPNRSSLLGLRVVSSLEATNSNNSRSASDIRKLIELIPCINSEEGCTDLESQSSCSRLRLDSAGDSLVCESVEYLDGGNDLIRGSARALAVGEVAALVAKLVVKPRRRRETAQVWSGESNSALVSERQEALGVGFTDSLPTGASNLRSQIERSTRANRAVGLPLELNACADGGRTSFFIYDSQGNKRLAIGCAETSDSVKIKLADEEPVGIKALEANQMGVISMAGGADFQPQLKRRWQALKESPASLLSSLNSAEVYRSSRRNLTRGLTENDSPRFGRASSVLAAALERAMEAGSQGRGLEGAWAGPEPESAGPFECAMRRYKYKATNKDAEGNSCSGELSATICYGHCDTGEIADWLYPHKKSIHRACVHGGRVLRRALLPDCSEGASERLAEYSWMEATSCVCKRCNSDDTTCLSSPARINSRSQLDEEKRSRLAVALQMR